MTAAKENAFKFLTNKKEKPSSATTAVTFRRRWGNNFREIRLGWGLVKDALHENEVKVGEPISAELAIFRTKRFIEAASEEKMKKIAPYIYMIPQNCEALQVKTRNREIWYMLRGQHKKKK